MHGSSGVSFRRVAVPASAHTTVAKNGEPVFGAWLLASSLQKTRYC